MKIQFEYKRNIYVLKLQSEPSLGMPSFANLRILSCNLKSITLGSNPSVPCKNIKYLSQDQSCSSKSISIETEYNN